MSTEKYLLTNSRRIKLITCMSIGTVTTANSILHFSDNTAHYPLLKIITVEHKSMVRDRESTSYVRHLYIIRRTECRSDVTVQLGEITNEMYKELVDDAYTII
jgi:hypothetical protein